MLLGAPGLTTSNKTLLGTIYSKPELISCPQILRVFAQEGLRKKVSGGCENLGQTISFLTLDSSW